MIETEIFHVLYQSTVIAFVILVKENITTYGNEQNIQTKTTTYKISEENISNSDMVLTIQTDKTGLLETEKLDECYKYGYRQTIEQIDKIKEIIKG